MKGDSPKRTLNKKDSLKILKGACLAAGGGAVIYLIEILPSIDFGELTYVLIPIVSIILNAALKFVQGK